MRLSKSRINMSLRLIYEVRFYMTLVELSNRNTFRSTCKTLSESIEFLTSYLIFGRDIDPGLLSSSVSLTLISKTEKEH